MPLIPDGGSLRKRLRLFLLFISFISFTMLPAVHGIAQVGEHLVLEAVGESTSFDGNMSLARDMAVTDALKKAVALALERYLSPEAMENNREIIDDAILLRSGDFIDEYFVVDEGSDGDRYRVAIRAYVIKQMIADELTALGMMRKTGDDPGVLVIIVGRGADDAGVVSVVENVFRSALRGKGYYQLTPALPGGSIGFPGTELSTAELVELGEHAGAELVIFGKALASSSELVAGTAMRSCEARVTVRALRTADGNTVATADAHGAFVGAGDEDGIARAMEQAASRAAEEVTVRLGQGWRVETSAPPLVSLTVRGIASYPDFAGFRDLLKNTVKGVTDLSYRSMSTGMARFDVSVRGGGLALAESLSSLSLNGGFLSVTDASPEAVELTIIK
ncbi:MAG: hypothetical protein JXO48_03460 [Deltaproteobacteria bacterium]|nr:hypothetical protein [Deltaproteobacteria bacterium]